MELCPCLKYGKIYRRGMCNLQVRKKALEKVSIISITASTQKYQQTELSRGVQNIL